MPKSSRPARPAHSATVTATEWISRDMVRVTASVTSDAFDFGALTETDHYVKLLFPPAGASYSWPFDPAQVREELPREQWPVTRTYTLRSWDTEAGTVDIDFVAHGDSGLAGPWAAAAQPGDQIGFMGPGGAWHPESQHVVFIGDEAAAPAIFAGIEALPQDATGEAWVEIASAEARLDAPSHPGVTLHWVERDGATHGTELVRQVVDAGVPSEPTQWFIHGVAEMIRDLRRFLFVENGVAKSDVSISGYWRLGMVEDEWQASKREFNEEIEAAEAAAQAAE